ncbi:C39 family peptidase [Patescibacteria group bacterium]|nr:C39 family peptidase [Patescibacteria group bacterium]
MFLRNKYKIFIILFTFFLFLINQNIIAAQSLPFYENFDSYLAGSLPINWNSDAIDPSYWKVSENKLIGYTPSNGRTNHILYNSNWENYNLDLEIKGISGIDRFIVFRVDHSRGYGKEEYYFKYTEGNLGVNSYIELGKGSSGPIQECLPQNTFYSQNGQSHLFQIKLNNNNIKILEIVNGNKILLFDCTDNNALLSGGIGFFNQPNGIGSTTSTMFEVDNIIVTPQMNDIVLNVPNVKQYDPSWKNEIYDHANIWATEKSSIERWGCALTAASMVLQYYNHYISPKELNNWLKSQKDGYLINGNLNWIAISRYTKINSLLKDNLSILELQFLNNDHEILNNEILAQPKGRPAILKIPNHFVVAKGISNNDYYINDPGSEKDKLSEITHNYLSLIKFSPSFTDLSYIMLVYDEDLKLSIKDPNNNKLSNKHFSIEKPPFDNIDQNYSLNKNIGIFYLPKPQNGNYKIDASKKGIYTIESYMYNNQGDLTKKDIRGILNNNTQTIYINYGDKYNFSKEIDINIIINEVKTAFYEKMIYKKMIYKQITNQLNIAKYFIQRNKLRAARHILKVLEIKLFIFNERNYINSETAKILLLDISSLNKSI